MTDMTARFAQIVGEHNLLTGDAISDDYAHDEVLTKPPQRPAYPAFARSRDSCGCGKSA